MIVDALKLKQLLSKKGITKSYLCKALKISSRTLAKISKGENINDRVIEKIADYFGINIDALKKTNCILQALQHEKQLKISGGLYHETQIKLTYNSNHIEGSALTESQTRYIFETRTLGKLPPNIKLDDVIETNNHFKCIDYIIEIANCKLTEKIIIKLQHLLKAGTEYANPYGSGIYKKFPNTVGGIETTPPQQVAHKIKELLGWYSELKKVAFEDVVEFHYKFEVIHPFQDGNGRVGRLIAFKECLKNDIVPFYIDDTNKWLYYRGLQEWHNDKNFLIETCKFGQDQYKILLDYFNIKY